MLAPCLGGVKWAWCDSRTWAAFPGPLEGASLLHWRGAHLGSVAAVVLSPQLWQRIWYAWRDADSYCSKLLRWLYMPKPWGSWRQRYRPSPKAFGQQLRICSSVPLLWHSWQAGESTKRCRLDGLGRRSYTELMRNLMCSGSELHKSTQVILRCSAFCHLVQAPCCRIPTILVKSSQVTFIYIVLWTIQIVSKQLHSIKIVK